jgi:hypothetical protein
MYIVRGLDICTPEQTSKTCFNPCSNQIPQLHDKYSVPVPRDILTSPTDTINTATIIHQYHTAVLPMTIPNSHTDFHSQSKFQSKFQTQSNSHLPPWRLSKHMLYLGEPVGRKHGRGRTNTSLEVSITVTVIAGESPAWPARYITSF